LALVNPQQVYAASTSGTANANSSGDLFEKAPNQPYPSTQPVIGLATAGSDLIGVGLRGLIIRSEDNGKTWQQISSPVATDLIDVQFSDSKNGWAVGHDSVLLQTDDGGRSWSVNLDGKKLKNLLENHYSSAPSLDDFERENMLAEIDFATSTSANPEVIPTPFLNVHIDENGEGFVLGAFGMLLYTDDNGESWVPWIERTDNERRMHLYGIASADDGSMYISGEQGLLMRLDRELKRFVEVNIPYPGTLFGVSIHGEVILAYGLRGNLFASKDHAGSWSHIENGQKGGLIDAIRLDENYSLIVSQRGEMTRLNHETLRVDPVDTAFNGAVNSMVLVSSKNTLVAALFNGTTTLDSKQFQ
tara:strand:+ start:7578 stop:8657 length:1080 start_codon:yes stop_codon:yes gene_type:complete